MWPFLGGIASGIGSMVSGWFGSDTAAKNTQANIAMQRETNEMNIAEAQKNRDFQQQMSNTAFQRSSADMQQAGLNPMMMFGSGGPASTPGGAQGHATAPRSELQSPWQGLGNATEKIVSSAIGAKTFERMTEEIANLQAQEARTKAETLLTHRREQTEKSETRKRFHEANTAKQYEDVSKVLGQEARSLPKWLIDNLHPVFYGAGKTAPVTDQVATGISSALGLKRFKFETAPRRSTTQESGTDQSGQWYDRFRDHKEWR